MLYSTDVLKLLNPMPTFKNSLKKKKAPRASIAMLGEAQESLASLLGNNREPSLREQIEEMSAGGGGCCCCSLTFEVRPGLLCRAMTARKERAHARLHP